MDMEQQTGSKLGEEYIKAVYIHPAYLPYMQSQFSHTVMLNSVSPWLQHIRPPCPTQILEVYSNSYPLMPYNHHILCHPLLKRRILVKIEGMNKLFNDNSWKTSSPHLPFSSVQSLSHVPLCEPMNCSIPGLPVHHQLPESTQTHVH